MPSPVTVGPYTVSNPSQEYYFGELAIRSSIHASTGPQTGPAGGSISGGSPLKLQSLNGVSVCSGISFNVKINSGVWANISPGIGVGPGVTGYIIPGTESGNSVSANIVWQTYIPPPVEPTVEEQQETPEVKPGEELLAPAVEVEKKTSTMTWYDQYVVIAEGINEECIDTHQSRILKQGKKAALNNINNPYIPNVATAQEIGEAAIYESLRSLYIVLSVPPMFMAALGDFVRVIYSWYFIDTIARLEGMDFVISDTENSVNWHFYVKETQE